MKLFISIIGICILLLLTACVSAFSIHVDNRPEMSPKELSTQLSAHYAQLTYTENTTAQHIDAYNLGSWYSKSRGFIGHEDKEGVLRIWIAPLPQVDNAHTVVADLKNLLADIAPEADVQIKESRTPDIR